MTARISDRGDVNAFAQFPELALGAPEAAHPEHRHFEARRVWLLQPPAKNEMLPRGRDRCRAARQRLGRGRHFKLLVEHEHATSPLVPSQYSGGGARAHLHWTPLTHHIAAKPDRGPAHGHASRDQRGRRSYIAHAGETLCCRCMHADPFGTAMIKLEETRMRSLVVISACAALLISSAAQAQQAAPPAAPPPYGESINLEQARTIVDAAMAEAKKNK